MPFQLGSEIRVSRQKDPNVPFKWRVKSGGQLISGHESKAAARTRAKQEAEKSTGEVDLVIETADGRVQSRKTYEATTSMPGFDDIDI